MYQITDELYQFITAETGSVLGGMISAFSAGLILATALNFLGYGIFKALSLLNIK